MELLQILQDIASNVKVKPSVFLVSYHNYESPPIIDDVIKQLQKLPQEVQDKYLSSLLCNLIYDIYYSGLLGLEKKQAVKKDYQIGSKNTAFEIDWEFYQQLHDNNTGKGTFIPGHRVLRQETDGSLAVERLGVTLHIQPSRDLELADPLPAVGDLVAVWCPSSTIERGFYNAIGDVGIYPESPSVFVYFNFSPEGAVTVMKNLTTGLNAAKVSFNFLVSYNPYNYGRYDSGFLIFRRDNYNLIRQVLQAVYSESQPNFQTQVPLFTKALAPGLSLAESPQQQFILFENLGMNRCQIVANALLEAHQNGDESPEARMKYIIQHFEQMGIEVGTL
ncbi:MAG: hypothetical protein F6K44_33935 [Moorea sp. SIO3E2]|nr:hypothetical protein [Moorena sp. SIO3E2]